MSVSLAALNGNPWANPKPLPLSLLQPLPEGCPIPELTREASEEIFFYLSSFDMVKRATVSKLWAQFASRIREIVIFAGRGEWDTLCGHITAEPDPEADLILAPSRPFWLPDRVF